MSSQRRNAEKRRERFERILSDAERATSMERVADDVNEHYTKALARIDHLEAVLREAYQISHYGRGSMQDIDDVLERAIRLCGGFASAKDGKS